MKAFHGGGVESAEKKFKKRFDLATCERGHFNIPTAILDRSIVMLTSDFDALVEKSLRRAWKFLRKEMRTVKTEAVTEGVFRYFFIRSLPTRRGEISYETEWNGLVDLCVQVADATIVIEF